MIRLRESTIIDAPLETVWALLRDFNGHDRWHPAVVSSRIEQGRASDEVGAVRRFSLASGGELRERLLRLSERDHSFTYCIVEAPLPLIDYVATVRLAPVTDGNRTFWEWSSSFAAPPGREDELAALVAKDIYRAGFAAVRRRLGDGPQVETPVVHVDPRPVPTEAVVVSRHGGPEVLEMRTLEAPAPRAGEVRLRHTAIGVNFIDVYCRSGYFDLVPPGGVPGMEAAGVVEAVGPGVRGLSPGDRVAYACAPPGAYCRHRTMAADLLVPLPDDVPDEVAAAILLKGAAAEFLLHRVHRVKEGDIVLVHAAAGGIGQMLCRWAGTLGATVIGTVGSAEKESIARAAGCAYVIRYREEDFAARALDITGGRGVDVVYDAVGRDTFLKSYEALAVRGHLVSYGQASGDIGPVEIARFAGKSATVSRPNYGHYMGTPAQVLPTATAVFTAWRQGILRPDGTTRLPLADAAEAHRLLESRATSGPLVLTA